MGIESSSGDWTQTKPEFQAINLIQPYLDAELAATASLSHKAADRAASFELAELSIDLDNDSESKRSQKTETAGMQKIPEEKEQQTALGKAEELNKASDLNNDSVAKSQVKEAGPYLFTLAKEAENKSIYRLPSWARLPKPSADLGCVSSFSNRFRQAMVMAGLIANNDEKTYRNYYQVNMDALNNVLGIGSQPGPDSLLRPISAQEAKEGDIIQGLTPGTTSRHMGILGSVENGSRTVYNNYSGLWRKENIETRFGKYPVHNYYRVYLPPKK